MHGPKRKNALERSVPLRDGGRREMVPADSRWLSDGRGGVPQRLDSGFPRRGCGGQRGARTHLTSFSFRAFRFATRCPGGRRSGSLAYAAMLHLSSTTGQRQRKEKLDVSQTSPGQRFPQGSGVSVPDFYKGVPAIPRRRQEVCACADRPAEAPFSLPPGAAHSLFGQDQKENGGRTPVGTALWREPDPPRSAARISPGGR